MQSVDIDALAQLHLTWPHRTDQIETLNLLLNPSVLPVRCLNIFGRASTGKSGILRDILLLRQLSHVFIDLQLRPTDRMVLAQLQRSLLMDEATWAGIDPLSIDTIRKYLDSAPGEQRNSSFSLQNALAEADSFGDELASSSVETRFDKKQVNPHTTLDVVQAVRAQRQKQCLLARVLLSAFGFEGAFDVVSNPTLSRDKASSQAQYDLIQAASVASFVISSNQFRQFPQDVQAVVMKWTGALKKSSVPQQSFVVVLDNATQSPPFGVSTSQVDTQQTGAPATVGSHISTIGMIPGNASSNSTSLLSSLVRLGEEIGRSTAVVLVSRALWTSLDEEASISQSVRVHFPTYQEKALVEILTHQILNENTPVAFTAPPHFWSQLVEMQAFLHSKQAVRTEVEEYRSQFLHVFDLSLNHPSNAEATSFRKTLYLTPLALLSLPSLKTFVEYVSMYQFPSLLSFYL